MLDTDKSPHRSRVRIRDRLIHRLNWPIVMAGSVAGAGAAFAIAAMEWASAATAYPLAIIPFATSIVLVIGAPEAEPAQPRALIGGHLVSSLVGLVVLHAAGPTPWAAAVAVGLAVLAMFLTATFHPPAGIDPLVIVYNTLSWSFLVAPVLVGAVLLTIFALAWHRLVGRRDWPRRWW